MGLQNGFVVFPKLQKWWPIGWSIPWTKSISQKTWKQYLCLTKNWEKLATSKPRWTPNPTPTPTHRLPFLVWQASSNVCLLQVQSSPVDGGVFWLLPQPRPHLGSSPSILRPDLWVGQPRGATVVCPVSDCFIEWKLTFRESQSLKSCFSAPPSKFLQPDTLVFLDLI